MATPPVIHHAVIPAAGWGTRLLPWSACCPKELVPIGEYPALYYSVMECLNAGVQKIILITSPEKRAFFEHVFDPPASLLQTLELSGNFEGLRKLKTLQLQDHLVLVEQERPLGLGHAVACAGKVVGDHPFLVVLPDEHLLMPQSNHSFCHHLIQMFSTFKASLLGLMQVARSEVSKYGIVTPKGDTQTDPFAISEAEEKPNGVKAKSCYAIIGRYLFEPQFWGFLENTRAGKGGEIQLTDAINAYCFERKLLGTVFKGIRFDIGTFKGYSECLRYYLEPVR
jgi:UTP--glucose-1-phosphate uridylyltransferase